MHDRAILGRPLAYGFEAPPLTPSSLSHRQIFVPARHWAMRTRVSERVERVEHFYAPETEWLTEFLGDADEVEVLGMRGWRVVTDGYEYMIPREWDHLTTHNPVWW
jgi:hypothetical protein